MSENNSPLAKMTRRLEIKASKGGVGGSFKNTFEVPSHAEFWSEVEYLTEKRKLGRDKATPIDSGNFNQQNARKNGTHRASVEAGAKGKRKRENPSGKSGRSHSNEELELDPDVLVRRQKQINFGKATEGYKRYVVLVPRDKRTSMHPHTPRKELKFSRRSWDMQ
ncbi:hypothetical protein BIW11_12627, partial [Tropilaelaps mercedesae]